MKMLAKISVFVLIIAVAVWYVLQKSSHKASSVVFLALNFLARPTIDLQPDHRFEPISLPSAWNGSYLSKNPHLWIYELDDADKSTIHSAVHHFERLNKTMEEMVVATDFPITSEFLAKIQTWKRELTGEGKGFQVLRGVPVKEWTVKQSEIFFFALGKLIGVPGAQDVEGSLLGHVVNVGETGKVERPYRKSVDIAYHCDGADLVGLLCLHPAKSGGASRLISSVTVYNELLKHLKGQQYIRRLFGKVLLFTRKTFGLSPYLPVHPLRLDHEGVLRSYWNQEFYVKSYRFPENGTLTPAGAADPFVLEAVLAYDAILNTDIARAQAREQRLLAAQALQQQKEQDHSTQVAQKASVTQSADAGENGQEEEEGEDVVDVDVGADGSGVEGDSAATVEPSTATATAIAQTSSTDQAAAEIAAAAVAQEEEQELGLSMYLQQGDVQLVSNHFVLHARTEFTDFTDSEIAAAAESAGAGAGAGAGRLAPIGKRELLRLWVSHPSAEMSWGQWLQKQADLVTVLANVVEGVIKYR